VKQLYSFKALGYRLIMSRAFFQQVAFICLLFMMQTGCTTSTIVNLTPPSLPRNAEGLYRFEASWESNQRSILDESLEAFVVMDGVQYPMEPVPVTHHRWEALIPLGQKRALQHYHFKFVYQANQFPQARPDSLRTNPFSLEIIEPNQP